MIFYSLDWGFIRIWSDALLHNCNVDPGISHLFRCNFLFRLMRSKDEVMNEAPKSVLWPIPLNHKSDQMIRPS